MNKLLFTGASGFLGRNIMPILAEKYDITTIGIMPSDTITTDLTKEIPELHDRYDVVLHAAGKAHINPKTEDEKKSFYELNLVGTINLCKALEASFLPKSLIFISTLSVYGDNPGQMDTEESRSLIGDSPYSDSKIKAEEYLSSWCKEHNVVLGILRPSILAGKNAPGNLGAMVNGIRSGAYLSIAGGQARKSMLMADDIAYLVPLVAEKGGTYNVCDDNHPSFRELEVLIAKQLGKRPPISIPYWMAKCLAMVGDLFSFFPINSKKLEKITTSDVWSNEKAKRELGWQPMDVLENYKI